jgi:hypothetical protein
LVPGQNESSGKRKSAKTKKGNKYLRSALTEAAHSVRGSKNYLGSLYRRTVSRKGKKRAGIVVAHAILRIAYYLLTRKEMYVDLGEDYFKSKAFVSLTCYGKFLRLLCRASNTIILTKLSAIRRRESPSERYSVI